MFFTLQIVCYLKIYDVPIPGNADIYIVEFTKLIEFDVLNPDSIIRLISGNPDFKLTDWVLGKSRFSSDESPSMIDDLRVYIIWAVAAVAIVLMLALLLFIKKLKKKIKKLLWNMQAKFLFNGIIRSITIMYIQLCMSFGSQIEVFIQDGSLQPLKDSIVAVVMFVVLFGYPVLCWAIIIRKKEKLELPEVLRRYSNLYQEVRLSGKQNWKLVYYPLFLFRRIVFVAIPTFLFLWPSFQIQLLIFLTSLYILFYIGERPHWETRRTRIEVFNEVMILGACYHLALFSDFNIEVEA